MILIDRPIHRGCLIFPPARAQRIAPEALAPNRLHQSDITGPRRVTGARQNLFRTAPRASGARTNRFLTLGAVYMFWPAHGSSGASCGRVPDLGAIRASDQTAAWSRLGRLGMRGQRGRIARRRLSASLTPRKSKRRMTDCPIGS